MDPNAAVCVRCGYGRGTGGAYCFNCGAETVPGAAFCTRCGASLAQQRGPGKSRIAAGLLGIFLGCLGVHNFFLGYTGKALAQLLITVLSFGTLGVVSAVWGLVEGILILTGSISQDGHGNPLSD